MIDCKRESEKLRILCACKEKYWTDCKLDVTMGKFYLFEQTFLLDKCLENVLKINGVTKLLSESVGMKGWKWSAKNFSQNVFGRVLLGDLQWRVEIDWAQGFFAKCFWSSFLFSFSSVTCTTCLHRQRIQSSAFTDWKFKKRNTIYLTALRSGEWKKHNAQMCSDVSFLIRLFLTLQSVHGIARCLHDFRGHLRCGKWGSFTGSCFPHFWSPCLPCFDGSCFPDWLKTGWGPLSVNLNISKLLQFHQICHPILPFHLASPHFTNPVRYLSAPV